MNVIEPNECDENRLIRALDDGLDAAEKERLERHLETCRSCRRHLSALTGFTQELRSRIDRAADTVDFTALEKDVLTKALRQHRPRHSGGGMLTALKFGLPAVATACLLLFFSYNQMAGNSAAVPSAIINSFTGSMSSVMIFETPETRQTILWYTEDVDVESETDAV